jgi:hypothetical protein
MKNNFTHKEILAMMEVIKPIIKTDEEYEFHFSENWKIDTVSISALEDLSKRGISMMSVPSQITQELEGCKSKSEISSVLVKNEETLIRNCRQILNKVKNRDYRDHFEQAIKCYEKKYYRASQSAASVIIDSKLEDIFDMKTNKWRAYALSNRVYKDNLSDKEKKRELKRTSMVLAYNVMLKVTSELFKYENGLPLNPKVPYYALLTAKSLESVFEKDFTVADKRSLKSDNFFHRHRSAHSVSSKVFTRVNALVSIMLISDLMTIEDRYAKNWMEQLLIDYRLIGSSQ